VSSGCGRGGRNESLPAILGVAATAAAAVVVGLGRSILEPHPSKGQPVAAETVGAAHGRCSWSIQRASRRLSRVATHQHGTLPSTERKRGMPERSLTTGVLLGILSIMLV